MPFWPFWPPISEAGWTSRKKVPLGVRLKSARRSQFRRSPHVNPHRGENRNHDRGCHPTTTGTSTGRRFFFFFLSFPHAPHAAWAGARWCAPRDFIWRALPGGVGAAALATDAGASSSRRFRPRSSVVALLPPPAAPPQAIAAVDVEVTASAARVVLRPSPKPTNAE